MYNIGSCIIFWSGINIVNFKYVHNYSNNKYAHLNADFFFSFVFSFPRKPAARVVNVRMDGDKIQTQLHAVSSLTHVF